ncbi:MAG: RidA family protein [Cyclobacteriaceae bacterium]|nr:hypothetical protein [Cytophagales bacterium]HNP77667.1 RidA family protein [Cyclobacteriaceae bacterium]
MNTGSILKLTFAIAMFSNLIAFGQEVDSSIPGNHPKTNMERKDINSPKVPRYSTLFPHAVQVDKFVFVSGTPGYDLATGKVVSDDLEAQTRQCYKNLSAILEEAGTNLSNVVKITQFVVSGSDMTVVNKVFKEFFPDVAPARSSPMVSPFPAGILISMECIAVK